MRQANFGLGNHLPESNKYALHHLTESSPNANARPTNFHLTAQNCLKQQVTTPARIDLSPPRAAGGVSSGMIGRGLPNNTGT